MRGAGQASHEFNATRADRPRDRQVQHLFEEQARRAPDALAVIHADRAVTYADLNERAEALARQITDAGMPSAGLGAICIDRSLEMIVGVLGILKAGGAYLPLDPNYPAERLHYMLSDAAPHVLLTQGNLRALLPEANSRVILVDHASTVPASQGKTNIVAAGARSATDPVYVIYTSGSTGTPKGTAMAHYSMVNLIEWHRSVFGSAAGKRVLQFAALSFDVAFQEIFTTLCTGGTLVLLDEWQRKDTSELMSLLVAQRVQRLFLPPLMLHSLADVATHGAEIPTTLEDVITAGEQLRISTATRSWFKQLGRCRLHNHYGPTETHVVTALTLPEEPEAWPALPSIGGPIANTRIYILDEQRRPVPFGTEGEIYIGGAGVARGYLHKPELTAQRFLDDPFSDDTAARMYKTGDLGCWQTDGTIEYRGRNDDQVKIRGFRVELGEIENRLVTHEFVKEAAAMVREDVPGEKRLVAYVVPRSEWEPDALSLREHLGTRLPEHMLPSAFVVVERLPQTPSGKLDRRALPRPSQDAYIARRYEAPQGETESLLAEIWQQLLRVERVGRHDNFFELGGDSLLIAQLLGRLKERGLHADVRQAFAAASLADVAKLVTVARPAPQAPPPSLIPADCQTLRPEMVTLVDLDPQHIDRIVSVVPGGAANIQDIYPLTPMQEGMLFHHLLTDQRGDTYVLPILFSLDSREKLDHFISALQQVIDRHDILRTAVLWNELPRPVQVVHRKAPLPVHEIRLERDRPARDQMRDLMNPELQRLDLTRAPLMRLQVAAAFDGPQWYALMQVHHLICDHEALETLFAEVMLCLGGRGTELPPASPYRDHVAEALVHAGTQDAETFFRRKLQGIDASTAPFGVLDVQGDGVRIMQFQESLQPELAARIRVQARRMGVSAATLFHAAWSLVIAHTSGRDDVVFGTLLMGRLQGGPGTQRVLGMFMNTLPLRLRLHGVSACELVVQTHRELIELLAHEQASLAVAQRAADISGSAPLFTALLNYRHSVPGLETTEAEVSLGVRMLEMREWTNYPVTVAVDDLPDGFTLTSKTDRRIDHRRVLRYLATAIESVVAALQTAPQTKALSLSILPSEERQQVLELFNATQALYPDRHLIHELFEEQVRRSPQASAVVCQGQTLTYEALNRRANQLANHLRSLGVSPDSRVAICLPRSLELPIALLGVLKAGGCYVPLDHTYPTERLAYLLEDAAPVVVVTLDRFSPNLPASAKLVTLDRQWPDIASRSDGNPERAGCTPEHMAYVMYTSGSTGQPKGVMVCHRNIVNYSVHMASAFDVAAGGGALIGTSMNFDLSLTGLYPTLICGRCITICGEDEDLSQCLLAGRDLAPVKLTPSHLKMLTLPEGSIAGCVRSLVVGGESLLGQSLRWWREHSPQTRIFNHYGPTETTVGCIVFEAPQDIEGAVPIGRPIANTQVYILNAQLAPVPIGAVGEMYIAGAGVARGYWNRPELSAQRFVRNPFSADPQACMYKTGDLGRWGADGVIEYLGRNDDQVKIRGFRIELGEIEAQLELHAGVREAAVVAREDSPGEKRLVAYVIPRDPSTPPAIQALREHIKTALPEYMIPSAIMALERLPLTANGKLDRRALPEPDLQASVIPQYAAPEGPVEEALAEIWQQLLGVQRVGRHDNFFDLGGHSLLAMQLAVRVRSALFVSMPVRLPFELPTLQQLAERVAALRDARLLEQLDQGGDGIEELLESVAALPDCSVQEAVRRLRQEARS